MLVIALALVAAAAVSANFVIYALACTAMMMRGMHRGATVVMAGAQC